MSVLMLLGGGEHPDANMATYGRFLRAAQPEAARPLLLIIVEADADNVAEAEAAYRAIFHSVGAPPDSMASIAVTLDGRLRADDLSQISPAGVFVCGGVTPHYQEALCRDRAWLRYLAETGVPFGGVSAGAAIAAEEALVGGWRARRHDDVRPILFQGASEGLDLLETRQGLGLVPFSLDVHASQWGTLTRLIHAVDFGVVGEGWAIDENTLLQVETAEMEVHGSGHVYHVRRDDRGSVAVSIFIDGNRIARDAR